MRQSLNLAIVRQVVRLIAIGGHRHLGLVGFTPPEARGLVTARHHNLLLILISTSTNLVHVIKSWCRWLWIADTGPEDGLRLLREPIRHIDET